MALCVTTRSRTTLSWPTAKLIRANAGEHDDLLWALKGGGGNFGVVTSITYRLYTINSVISGMVLHPLARARDVLEFYRDFVMSGIPDELTVYAAALTTPDGHPVVALIPCWCGDLAQGRIIDLSYGAAEKLAMTEAGLAPVVLEVLSPGRP